ncbi:hypothetical protein [Flavobacterium album]|nr:hypothetical protein [Flavobacterium album]
MKTFTLLLCLLSFGIATAQQNPAPVKATTQKEWDELDKNFIALVDALVKGDKTKFLALSCKEVDCVDCVGAVEAAKGAVFVPAEFYFTVISQKFTESPVYKAMAKKGYSFSSVIVENFKPKVVPKDYPKDLKIYEVWVETYKKDEFAKGHPGTSHSFRFIKINGKFRFYGMTSIP